MPYLYAHLSSDSGSSADMQLTSPSCSYSYGPTNNACAWVTGINPSETVMFTISSGPYTLDVQASPAGTPTGSTNFDENLEVTVNTVSGTVTFGPWDPTTMTEEQRAKVIKATTPRSRAESAAAPAAQRA